MVGREPRDGLPFQTLRLCASAVNGLGIFQEPVERSASIRIAFPDSASLRLCGEILGIA